MKQIKKIYSLQIEIVVKDRSRNKTIINKNGKESVRDNA